MKLLSVLLACVAVTDATVVVCRTTGRSTNRDVVWAIKDKTASGELFGAKRTSGVREMICPIPVLGENRKVVVLCMSEPYPDIGRTRLSNGEVICQASGSPNWATCNTKC
ncbi:uncharacterized protein RCO7_10229 [Rhynchosporium graminicola]|uniref:Uncharacterized protein n=1 Tax=Rhynchosporium graminicola TaxID=2792576 RepID=A0A1E1LAN0_9HELO|nr:uncharacterized protein RCO7_10229 [Rhynchosporium commune]